MKNKISTFKSIEMIKVTIYAVCIFCTLRIAKADSFSTWVENVNAYIDSKIENDPYNIYMDIKSDIKFLNDQCQQMQKHIAYQIQYTQNLLKYAGSEVSARSAVLSDKISTYPDAINEINEDFSTLKDSISGLPLKTPCYARTTSAIDNIKGREVDYLNKTMAFNQNNQIVSANMYRIVNMMHEHANELSGEEMEESMMEFRQEVSKQMGKIMKEYTKHVQTILLDLEVKLDEINKLPEAERAAVAQKLKEDVQKKLEMVRAKTLMDLQTLLSFVVHALSELQMDAQEMVDAYGIVLNRAGTMVNAIQSSYSQRVEGAATGGKKIGRIAGLTVTNPDGSKVDNSEYIPAYTLNDNEDIYSAAQAGMDVVILIVGRDENDVTYTRKIFKMYVDENTDWVFMWIYMKGEVIGERKYIYHYDKVEC